MTAGTALAQGPAPVSLPPIPQPAGNPVTEPKRVLGKILFWDEQLSTTGTMSCGSCHQPAAGGADPRRRLNPGDDNLPLTGDDILASPGQVKADASNNYRLQATFGLLEQVTGRVAQSNHMSAYSGDLFWDGRARAQFRDPVTNAVVLPTGGGLESQASGPPLSDVEMAHDARTWTQAADKIRTARPLALNQNLPADVAAALANNPSYPMLFAQAFGDGQVTASRIVQAIAAYQRTTVANQTPFDRWAAGDQTALTPNQRQGWAAFNAPQNNCNVCHTPPTFAGPAAGGAAFRNIGLRPVAEDVGRFAVTGIAGDRGRFKTPSLRNVGLRTSFMHTGVFTSLNRVMDFYSQDNGAPVMFTDNLDPAVQNITIPPNIKAQIVDFMQNALTDPRARDEVFPFDRPTMVIERPEARETVVAAGRSANGVTLTMVMTDPPVVGAGMDERPLFRIGVGGVPANAPASLLISETAPVGGLINADKILMTAQAGSDGVATAHVMLMQMDFMPGENYYAQWSFGSGASNARSAVVQFTPFCPREGCTAACPADIGGEGGSEVPDGMLDNNDFIVYIGWFFATDGRADIGAEGGAGLPDGAFDNNDFIVFIDRFFAPCM
jgi:cytochrome c peroxidase